MSYNIEIVAGSSKRLPTGGKYCNEDIIVKALYKDVELQEKTVEITESGTIEILPDSGKLLEKVTVNVDVAGGEVPIEYTEGLGYTSINSTYYGVSKEGWEGAEVLSIPPTRTAPYSGQSLPVTTLTLTSDFQDSFQDMTMIKRVYADSIAESESYSPFAGCTNLEYLSIRGLKMTVSFMFSGLTALKEVKLKYIKDIAMGTFSTRSSPCRFDFSECTHIPTLADTTVFGELVPGDQIVVPAALYDEWIVATNWANFASYIVAV